MHLAACFLSQRTVRLDAPDRQEFHRTRVIGVPPASPYPHASRVASRRQFEDATVNLDPVIVVELVEPVLRRVGEVVSAARPLRELANLLAAAQVAQAHHVVVNPLVGDLRAVSGA